MTERHSPLGHVGCAADGCRVACRSCGSGGLFRVTARRRLRDGPGPACGRACALLCRTSFAVRVCLTRTTASWAGRTPGLSKAAHVGPPPADHAPAPSTTGSSIASELRSPSPSPATTGMTSRSSCRCSTPTRRSWSTGTPPPQGPAPECADWGYDFDMYRGLLWKPGIKPLIAQSGVACGHGSRLDKTRRMVERAFALAAPVQTAPHPLRTTRRSPSGHAQRCALLPAASRGRLGPHWQKPPQPLIGEVQSWALGSRSAAVGGANNLQLLIGARRPYTGSGARSSPVESRSAAGPDAAESPTQGERYGPGACSHRTAARFARSGVPEVACPNGGRKHLLGELRGGSACVRTSGLVSMGLSEGHRHSGGYSVSCA